jgi:hypothetical protein
MSDFYKLLIINKLDLTLVGSLKNTASMKINLNKFEVEILQKSILDRISNTTLNSQIARLLELNDKVMSQYFEVKNKELSLLRGILEYEVWNGYQESYLNFMKMSVIKIINLSASEAKEFNLIEQILSLGNKIWSKDRKREMLSSKTEMYDFLVLNSGKQWYYSHINGDLYKLAIQINKTEFIQLDLKSDSHFPKIKECIVKAESLSEFNNFGNKNDLYNFVLKHKDKNQFYKRQIFVRTLLNKIYET